MNRYKQRLIAIITVVTVSLLGSLWLILSQAADPSGKGDINRDGRVTAADLNLLYAAYGTRNASVDVNGDGIVNVVDFSIVLRNFGSTVSATPPAFQLGANTIESGGDSATQRDQTVNQIIDSGASWVRINLIWSRIEPANNSYDPARLAQYDQYISKLNAAGIDTLVTVSGVPGWARGASATQPVPAHMADFMTYIADRYKGKTMGYQILNEVNADVNWPVGGATSYSELLSAVYPATKAGDSNALVVTSGMAYRMPTTPPFIEAMYQHGQGNNFDVLAIHAYPLPCRPPAACQDFDGYLSILRSKMTEAGDAGSPIWITEFGFSTSTGRSYQDQVDYARYYLPIIARHKAYIPHVVWYEIRDHYSPSKTLEQNKAEPEYNFGVYDVNGNPKPVRQVLLDFMAGKTTY